MSFKSHMEPEVKVFLKCLNCGTFLTSPCSPIIKKHMDTCQQTTAKSCGNLRLPKKNENGPYDTMTQCDFIDDKLESVTFSHPFVLVERLNSEKINIKLGQEGSVENLTHTSPVQLSSSSRKKRKKCQNESNVGNKRSRKTAQLIKPISPDTDATTLTSEPMRKSRLKAATKLSEIMHLEQEPEHDSSDEWELDEETAAEFISLVTKNKRKRRQTPSNKQEKLGLAFKPSCVYNDPKYAFKCTHCTARYTTEQHLTWHNEAVHQNKNDLIFSCSICDRMFSRRLTFQAHLKCHENAEDTEQEFNLWTKWPKLPKHVKDKKMVFNCKYCLKPHSDHRSFVRHMKSAHPNKGQHIIYQCPYTCNSRLDSIKQLTSHFKSDHVNEYYGKTMKWDEATTNELGRPKRKCEDCGKLFEIYYLAKHKELFHSANSVPKAPSEVTFKCPFPGCTISCRTVILLKGHFILHLKNNPYVCPVPQCDVKVDNACHLRRHVKLHLDTPPVCPKCGVSYASKYKFRNHKCDENVAKKLSGQFKLVKMNKSWRLKPLGKVREEDESSNTSDPVLENESYFKEFVESLLRIDINSIIRSDPVFIQACEDNPGFKQMILGRKEDDKHRVAKPRRRPPKKASTSNGDTINEKKIRKSGSKQKAIKKDLVDEVGCALSETISLDDKDVVRFKVEPELCIDTYDHDDFDQIGKLETDEFM